MEVKSGKKELENEKRANCEAIPKAKSEMEVESLS